MTEPTIEASRLGYNVQSYPVEAEAGGEGELLYTRDRPGQGEGMNRCLLHNPSSSPFEFRFSVDGRGDSNWLTLQPGEQLQLEPDVPRGSFSLSTIRVRKCNASDAPQATMLRDFVASR